MEEKEKRLFPFPPSPPEAPKFSEMIPKLGEVAGEPIRGVLGDKGPGKIAGDVITGALGVADSLVIGATKAIDSVVEAVDKTRKRGKRTMEILIEEFKREHGLE